MQRNPWKEKILKTIQKLGYRHSTWDIFRDWIELSALSVANSADKKTTETWQQRERQYLEIIGKYQPDEQQLFPELFAYLVEALTYSLTWENAPTDILGEIFHELELHNQYKGQFFTPQHICDFMGAITFGDSKEQVEKHGYIGMAEPACGSGAMVFGLARAMMNEELNYCTQLVVEATDIDLKCVHMCYLQLALYGIPAIVIHGNTLTMEKWSVWHTPVFVFHGWAWKVKRERKLDIPGDELPKGQEAVKAGEQLSLFDIESGEGNA